MENLARYIVSASFSQERMTCIPDESKVICQSKDGKEKRVSDALERQAAMCSHAPNTGGQMVRYYGRYPAVTPDTDPRSGGKLDKKNMPQYPIIATQPANSTNLHQLNQPTINDRD